MDIKGYLHFEVNGLNIEKLINNLTKEGVKLCDIDRKEYRKLHFSAGYMQGKKVIAYLERMCYNYKITRSGGLLSYGNFLLRRAGLIFGALMFAAFVTVSGFYVSDIKVYGCRALDPRSVVQSVNSLGVKKMSFNRGDTKKIEDAIYSQFGGISFVSAKYRGLVLEISIAETEAAPIVLDTKAKDIISGYDGKITRLCVFQGTALVKTGDTVKKGQALIGGYRLRPDGSQIPVRALGKAYGLAEIVYTEKFEAAKAVNQRNGRTSETVYIETFGIRFPVCGKNKNFTSYETEISYSYIFKNNFLPSRLVTVTLFETETVIQREDFNKVKKVLIEEAEKKASEKAAKEGTILGISTTVRDEGDIKYIDTAVHIEKSFIINGE